MGNALQSKSRRVKALACGILLVIVLSAILSLFSATPALAIPLPDSTPTVQQFNVYRNLLETGDFLLLIYANIPYAVTPNMTAAESYMWRLFKTDNVTEIAAIVPYAFNDRGYGFNLASMYLDSGNVTAAGIVGTPALPIKLSGNPSAFTTPPNYNYALSSGDYSPLTVSADVKAALAARLLTIASDLDIKWGLGTTYSLLQETETGTVLSIYGEAFFRGAIYGLQGLCPQVFAYIVSDMNFTPRTWADTYITVLQNQWVGTWVDTAKNALDVLFGTTYSLAWLIFSLSAALAVIIFNIVLVNDAWLGILDGFVVIIICTRLGFINLGYTGLMATIAWMYSSIRVWGVLR